MKTYPKLVKKSVLSTLIQRIQPKVDKTKKKDDKTEQKIKLRIYFEEHPNQKLLSINIIRMSVAETIHYIIQQAENLYNLRLGTAIQYDLRSYEEDDEEDSDE